MANPIHGHSPHPAGTLFGYDNANTQYVVIACDDDGLLRTKGGLGETIVLDYSAAGELIYLGSAVKGSAKSNPVWAIKKLTYTSGNLTDIQWAGGSTAMTNIWDNRVSLSYS